MTTPIALSTSFTDFTQQGSARAFCVLAAPGQDCVVAFESGLTLAASSGVRVKSPLPPSNIDTPTNAPIPDLILRPAAATAGGNLQARSPVMTEPSGYLRYVVLSGTVISVWVDIAPQPAAGPAGIAGPNWISQNAWALVTGTAYVATAGEMVSVNTAAATTVTLPTAVGIAGQRVRVEDATGGAATHNITIATTSAQTINGLGASSFPINSPHGGFTFISNGTNWVLETPLVQPVIPASLGPVVALSVANVASLSGLAVTVDGVALNTANMRVYLANQTTTTQNGIWLVQSGAWTRPYDWTSGGTIPLGTQIEVAPGGTANFASFGSTWYVDSASGVVDTGTIVAYPKVCKGQTPLTSGSPSTVTVSNLWVKSTTTSIVSCDDIVTAANGIKGVLTAGAGTGTLVLTGPNTITDTVAWSITNG